MRPYVVLYIYDQGRYGTSEHWERETAEQVADAWLGKPYDPMDRDDLTLTYTGRRPDVEAVYL